MKMRVTALVENISSNEDLSAEHGLSLYIETTSHKILFDMGQTELFAENAKKLGIDLSEIDIAILSHGHYDHGGGLKCFLEINDRAKVYISKYAFEPHYNGIQKYIGLDTSLQDNKRIIFTNDEIEIVKGLTLYSCNGYNKSFELGSFGLNKKVTDTFIPDDFLHEQYLLIEEDGKKVLMSGCSHKGILNIAEWFRPDILIGGFHFSKLPLDETLKVYAQYLDRFDTEYYTCHCTGVEQYEFMKQYMNRLEYIATGDSVLI